ncbi:YicC/YloC family endoribonuclease [Brevundimonas sp.]|uniref:YicC/YloC family endoribonuclease n=1 Tax=Brevundimonas sp. TaxID=1871086 RepID=UPI002626DDBE|nr:YicC/YloC family endoribonuclease [Brevundimonas sp.]
MSATGALSGMTGFGRADGAGHGWTWAIEARSVNGRNLEVRLRAPSGFDDLERLTKAAAQGRFARGQVSLTVQAKAEAGSAVVGVDSVALDRWLTLARQLVEAGAAPPTADGLLSLRGVIVGDDAALDPETQAALQTAIAATVDQALEALLASRRTEGAQLRPVLTGLVDRIETLVADAEREASAQSEAVRERFARRMAELAPDAPGLEERIYLEAATLAARADVREELDRLTAHVAAARALLAAPPAGRKLDFLMQEFMREANTLCSKSATVPLTAVGLELKSAVEQLREQVQNVE